MSQSTTVISLDAMRELQQLIADNHKAIGPEDVRKGFCSAWPAARVGLQALGPVLSLVPGVNTFAGPSISIVLAAGDAAKGALCK
jgi:hypothetical protein